MTEQEKHTLERDIFIAACKADNYNNSAVLRYFFRWFRAYNADHPDVTEDERNRVFDAGCYWMGKRMLYTPRTRAAMKISYTAHQDQVDHSGLPLVMHVLHIAEDMPDEDTTVSALLHEILDTTAWTVGDLRKEGVPEPVLEALSVLIRAPDEPYSEYIDRVGQNRIARCIKLADLRHEIDPGRFDMITKQDMAQISRCRAAISRLEAIHDPDHKTETRAITEFGSIESNGDSDHLRHEKMLRLREELSSIEEDWLRGEPGFSVEEVLDRMEQAINTGLADEQSF